MARRLAERGVRFIELIDGGTSIDHNWDAHAYMRSLQQACARSRSADCGLLRDLKSRGMLDDTVVVWTTEFGRTPCVPDPTAEGRGHHAKAYSSWVAGGGFKGGSSTARAMRWARRWRRKVSVHDLQATILNQLGLDHTRLTYRHAGRDYRLTDVHGRVIREMLT